MTLKNPRPIGLKRLKKIIGHKGESFARLVGVPYDTLKSIESGRLKMSKEVAHKIKMATGVRLESLYQKTLKKGDLAGGEYTDSYFHYWRSRYLGDDKTESRAFAKAQAERLAQYLGFHTKVLLLAAVEKSEKVTYGVLHLELASVIRDLAEKHKLGPTINRVLERLGVEHELELTKVEWMASPLLRQEYNVTDRGLKRVRDCDKFKAKKMHYRKWDPELGFYWGRAMLSES